MAETQMMCEVEAIRDGWRVVHVCQRDKEENRHLSGACTHTHTHTRTHTLPAHSDARAHAADAAAVKAITMIQTRLWETA